MVGSCPIYSQNRVSGCLFVVGWVLGISLPRHLNKFSGALRIDKLFASAGAENFLEKLE